MAGRNLTGLPDPADYNLGRGVLSFSLLNAAGRPTAWVDLGNAPSFNMTVSSETLEHQSSRQGTKTTDKEVVLSQSVELSFELDEINDQNLATLFSGEQASHTNVAIAGFTVYTMIPAVDVMLGRAYDIINAAGERAYGVLLASMTVVTTATTPITLVHGVDYDLDGTMGRIFLRSTSSVVATAIAASPAQGIRVTLAANGNAPGVNEVRGLTKTSVIGALKFVAENPANGGEKTEYQFHRVTLKADGDVSLIGDDWTTLPFTAKSERNEQADADSPYFTVRTLAS